MASHAYVRFILKTPDGYLTSGGTTENIADQDVIVLNILETGGYMASRTKIIANFLERSTAAVKADGCTVLWYACKLEEGPYKCDNCTLKKWCEFWENRENCSFRES